MLCLYLRREICLFILSLHTPKKLATYFLAFNVQRKTKIFRLTQLQVSSQTLVLSLHPVLVRAMASYWWWMDGLGDHPPFPLLLPSGSPLWASLQYPLDAPREWSPWTRCSYCSYRHSWSSSLREWREGNYPNTFTYLNLWENALTVNDFLYIENDTYSLAAT